MSKKIDKLLTELAKLEAEAVERFGEPGKPKTFKVTMSYDDHFTLVLMLDLAKQRLGTNRNAKALAHIVDDYYQHNGPHARTDIRIRERCRVQKETLEQQMKNIGPEEAGRIYRSVFGETV